MKHALLIVLSFALNTSFNHTVDTYDWSAFELALKHIDDAINTTTDAQIIIRDTYSLNIQELPQKTKSQLAILNDDLYRAWLTAESELGWGEANKYWDKWRDNEKSERLNCYEDLEDKMIEHYTTMFADLADCKDMSLTSCHLEYLQIAINNQMAYHQCIADKYGNSSSPLKPISGILK